MHGSCWATGVDTPAGRTGSPLVLPAKAAMVSATRRDDGGDQQDDVDPPVRVLGTDCECCGHDCLPEGLVIGFDAVTMREARCEPDAVRLQRSCSEPPQSADPVPSAPGQLGHVAA